MKLLNLDKLSTRGTRQLRIAGKDYQVLGMTVNNFIDTTLEAEKLQKEGNASLRLEVEAMVNMIMRAVPDVPREALTELELDSLKAISEFIKGEDVDGVEDPELDEAQKN